MICDRPDVAGVRQRSGQRIRLDRFALRRAARPSHLQNQSSRPLTNARFEFAGYDTSKTRFVLGGG